jgi:hypothetical protein
METQKIDSSLSDSEKARWKIVRTDNYTDVAGDIISADEVSGECYMLIDGEKKTLAFGPRGIRITRRGR